MKIGKREVIYSATLIIAPNEDAWVEFSVEKWTARFHLLFSDADTANKAPEYRFEAKPDHAEVRLINWNSPFGLTTPPLDVIRGPSGQKVLMMMWGVMVGGSRRVDVQFSVEAAS